MKGTGIRATKEDYDKLVLLAGRGWTAGQSMIVFSVDEGIRRDEATGTARQECHRLALAYGLPEIQGYYGINHDREFVTT